MHPCIGVDEIVRLLACELVASGGKATAVALACCCKSFEDPVLGALWETQEQLYPLLDTFPEGVWEEGSLDFVSLPTTPYLLSIKPLYREGFQENADDFGVDSLQQVCPTDAGTQIRRFRRTRTSARFLNAATSHSQRTPAPKSKSPRIQRSHCRYHSLRPPIPVPYDHSY